MKNYPYMANKKVKDHLIAAKKLDKIKDKTFNFISKNINQVSEYDVQQFILEEFRKESLVSDKNKPIVASGKNTALVHYYPNKKSRIIQKEDLILIDIWARVDKKCAYFVDITWMAYSGKKVPKKIQKTFEHVIKARDLAIKFIEYNLDRKYHPKTSEIDATARNHLKSKKIEKFFLHKLGHSLGTGGCHGRFFNFSKKGKTRLKPNIPFTIEPGIYFKNQFGIRSEIDCYVKNHKLIITTQLQNKLVKL